MRDNIFLIGFMGAGKSTIARTLRDLYGMRLIEMDEQIERQEGMKISRIFEEKGEAYFRALETELLRGLSCEVDTVVSCGGGVPMRQSNVDAMRQSGRIVYLSAKPETIFARVRYAHNRPLLEGNMNVAYIEKMLQERLPKYLAAADIIVETDGRSAREICRDIVRQ